MHFSRLLTLFVLRSKTLARS